MDTQDIISLIVGILGIGGVIFTVYNSFKNPQIKLEKEQIKSEEDLKDKATILSQKEVETKALLLAQQVQQEKEATEKRFADIGCKMDKALTLAENHTHTVDVKVDALTVRVADMDKNNTANFTRIFTILEERLPKK